MKPFYLLFFLFFGIAGAMTGQANYKWFSSISVSQNSNYYIYRSSRNQVFISSFDGLNIYDGLETKIYRQSTHHMYGNYIQSGFLEDSTGKVWFTTPEALHYYNPVTDDIDYTFIVDSCGDTLRSNYKVFSLTGNDLYLRAGNEIFVFDVVGKNFHTYFPSDITDKNPINIHQFDSRTLIFCYDLSGYEMYEISSDDQIKLAYKSDGVYSAVCWTDSDQLWIGKADGKLIQVDPQDGNILFETSLVGSRVNGILELSGGRLLVTVHPNELIEFDPARNTIVDHYIPRRAGTKEPVDYLLPPFMDRDSTLWVGGASQGVFFYNPCKQKFQHFLNAGSDQKPFNISRILPLGANRYLIFTRRQGILVINQNGDILQHWLELPDGIKNFTSTCATQIDDHRFLFSCNFRLYILDLKQQRIEKLQPDPLFQNLNFLQLQKLQNAKIIASCSKNYLLEIQLTENAYFCRPYAHLKDTLASTGNFKTDQAGNLYLNIDETSVLVLEPTPEGDHRFKYELPIRGGITSLMESQDKSGIYLTNTYGLFYIHADTREIDPIFDQDNLLSQTIYAVFQDTHGEFWLSSNKGILKYDPDNRRVKSYSRMDGVQADEFNTDAYLQTEDGGIFFGGINGLNFFYPEKVTLSTKEAPVYVNQIKINDEVDTTLRVPQFINQYRFPYKRNTISFDFHAIDYADPGSTRVKYKMVGVDHDYIESNSARGFARYANLQPGNYTFSIIGANADGVWNTTPREVEIIILRPFWMTWWFITLCILIGVAIVYLIIRSYYQRKLERNNQLLREQALIIEKQKAVEHERNRIASEMHDDLGSGLTTIRYLSDRALRQAKDIDESNQIRRIADHSNKLVRNMSEIIWAMNSRFDTAENLVGYLRRYASEYLQEHQIPLKFIAAAEHLEKITMGGEKRRNVFLVFKEMLHNGVKYSGAERIEIRIEGNHRLHIHISEIGGKGFDPALSLEKGNGLFNCRKRMDTVGGELTFEKTSEAMHIHITVPLNEGADG